jgi:cytochrome P450
VSLVEFDFRPRGDVDPYPVYAAMREAGRVLRSPLGPLFVTGYADVRAVHANDEDFSLTALNPFSSIPGSMAAPPPGELPDFDFASEMPMAMDDVLDKTMIVADRPEHERLRGVVSRAFTPRSIAALEPPMRDLARSLLEPLANGETVDLVADFAAMLPTAVISEMLGIPPEDGGKFRALADVSSGTDVRQEHSMEDVIRANLGLHEYMSEQVAMREKNGPTPDLIGRLVQANQDKILSHGEVVGACKLLLAGGNETTMRLISNMSLTLFRFPEQRERLVKDMSMMLSAIEETLRFDPPAQYFVRGTRRETVIADVEVSPGETVYTMLAGGNRDREFFPEPDVYDIGRSGNPHLSFGHGIHFCLGASVARLETRVAMEELLAVAPNYEVLTPDEELRYPDTFLHSPQSLMVRS